MGNRFFSAACGTLVVSGLAGLMGGCGKPQLVGDEATATAGSAGGAGPGGPSGVPPVPGFVLPDAGPMRLDGGPVAGADAACGSESHEAEQVPLDLVVLVDTSGSMYEMAGAQTKWLLTQNALRTFLKDPKSAGLGIGLQFFPLEGGDRPCSEDTDCDVTPTSPALPGSCAPKSVCTTNGQPVSMNRPCNPTALNQNEICPFGGTCTTLGRCSASGGFCYQVGQPCPGGGGMCGPRPTQCRNIGTGSCTVADYEKLVVPISELPAAEAATSGAIGAKEPIGHTPTAAAVEGTLNHLRQHLAANPGRKGALVLFTDGLPFGCASSSEAAVRQLILSAARATPPISTYVIGVFGAQSTGAGVVNGWAGAGGTGSAIVLSPTEDLTQRFLDSLNQIRGAALPCEFTIPAQTGAIDYGRVNVRASGAGGQQELLYVQRADRCDPMAGGWYYDVDPAAGRPTRVIICPASCSRFKADAATRLDLLFGCATRVVQ